MLCRCFVTFILRFVWRKRLEEIHKGKGILLKINRLLILQFHEFTCSNINFHDISGKKVLKIFYENNNVRIPL